MKIEERLLRVKGSTLGGRQGRGKRGWGGERKPNVIYKKTAQGNPLLSKLIYSFKKYFQK